MDEEQLAKVEDLLDVWEDALEKFPDSAITAEQLCRWHRCPELQNELASRMRQLRGTAWMNRR